MGDRKLALPFRAGRNSIKARTAPIPWRKAALPLSALLLLALLVLGWVQRETLFPQWFPKILRGHTDLVCAVAISPDGKTVASGSGDYVQGRDEVRLWDAHNGRLLYALRAFQGVPLKLAFSPDGQTLATGTNYPEGRLMLWDVPTGQARRVFLPGNISSGRVINGKNMRYSVTNSFPAAIETLCFSPDGKTLAAQDRNILSLWDVATGRRLWKLMGRKADETAVVFSPDGKTLVNMAPTKMIKHFELRPDGENKINFTFTNGQAQLLDAKTGRLLRNLPFELNSPTTDAVFSPDGKMLALISIIYDGDVGIIGGTLKIIDLTTNQVKWTQKPSSNFFSAVLFSPDGRAVVTEQAGENASFWDAQTGRPLLTLKNRADTPNGSPYGIAFSKDGRFLVCRDGTNVKIWRADLLRR